MSGILYEITLQVELSYDFERSLMFMVHEHKILKELVTEVAATDERNFTIYI